MDPAKHAYELEKFLRLAFSHDSVAGITLGDLWDRSANPSPSTGQRSSGLYAANKQAKPAAARLDRLWKEEWHTSVHDKPLTSDGSIEFDGYYGKYSYHLTAEDGKSCTGSIDLLQDPEEVKRKDQWGWRGAEGEAQVFVVKCNWEGHVHIPVWTTPAALALCAVSCLYACWRQKASLKNKGNRRGGQHQQIRPAGE